MRLIVDTHTLIWSIDHPARLSVTATIALQDLSNELIVSAATIWELSIKVGQAKLSLSLPYLTLGSDVTPGDPVGQAKLSLSLPYRQWMDQAIATFNLSILPITVEYADRQASLPAYHKDPFDRLIVAQALVEGIPLVSTDPQLDAYGITRIW